MPEDGGKKSEHEGVYWDAYVGAWIVVLYERVGKRTRKWDLGYYVEEADAAMAYKDEVRRRGGKAGGFRNDIRR